MKQENEELKHYEKAALALQAELTDLQHRHREDLGQAENLRFRRNGEAQFSVS